MSQYYEFLCELLKPLRIHTTDRGTVSGGELYAAGEALDEAAEALSYAERESILPLAECEGQGFTWESVEEGERTWESFEKAVSV